MFLTLRTSSEGYESARLRDTDVGDYASTQADAARLSKEIDHKYIISFEAKAAEGDLVRSGGSYGV